MQTDNEVGDTGITSLSEALTINTSITQLDLSGFPKYMNMQQAP